MTYHIRLMTEADQSLVSHWAQREGFCPGVGDVNIYRKTDRTGVWIGMFNDRPVGCIAGVRYDQNYGFIGMFIVDPVFRGRGYGVALWQRAIDYLENVACVGLEAALERVNDYANWGFTPAYYTRRYGLFAIVRQTCIRPTDAIDLPANFRLVSGEQVPEEVVQIYDARHEITPRPLFLREWLQHPEGNVMVILDDRGYCRGYGRIRPCLLKDDTTPKAWRIGPLLADQPEFAGVLLDTLLSDRPGPVLIDVPAVNTIATELLEERGFQLQLLNVRMYKGKAPAIPLEDIYGLASLELG
ncbi:MAG: GNAT family N-acetyltransferase [Microcystaceae cyanobacterium]